MTKPRILYLVHNFANLAGVEIHTKTLWQKLRPWFDTYLVHPEQVGPEESVLVLHAPDGTETRYPADPVKWPIAPHNLPKNEASLNQILDSVAPDLIHIQHFIHWPISVIDQCAAAGRPLFISFHDYFVFTPVFTMSGITDPHDAISSDGSMAHFGTDIAPFLKQRFNHLGNSIAKADKLITPAPYLARLIEQTFKTPVDVIEIGIEPFAAGKRERPRGPELRFGYVGSMIPQKGWDFLAKSFAEVHRRYPQSELLMFGGGTPPPINLPGVRFLGGYKPEELSGIMSQFDIGVIPSVFAETFSMMLSEMWLAGKQVAVSDIGALGERVTDGVNGKKFRAGNVAELVTTLLWFIENDGWRDWKIPQPRLVTEMIEEYRDLYRQAISAAAQK